MRDACAEVNFVNLDVWPLDQIIKEESRMCNSIKI